jgi:hypothetical protein
MPAREPNLEAEDASVTDAASDLAQRAGVEKSKKPYHRPSLKCYGGLVDLTRFGGSQFVDSGGLGNQP